MSGSQRVRCAVYTRKSSEEGLEQSFNSLDAQREACSAYILSQASEGWTEVKEHYDDGGLSRGTLERPALQRLLAEVAAGRVDIIVVYKVDRLTRSLLDFAKLVEAFDKAGTSFVSVTQSFNTTTSMGRLTLNMLLSLAQFEREVTAERIRDEIAASKAKGMWMGGTPPIGYAPDGRTLKIVDSEADLVRRLFERYLALGNVRLLEEKLRAGGTALPTRVRLKSGSTFGGGWTSRGQLYAILRNAIYIGRILHKQTSYAGLHPAIVDADVWSRTQAKLSDNRQGEQRRVRATSPSLLAEKVVDATGQPLLAVHACKGKLRYRYYVSLDLHHGGATSGMRIPARELEQQVALQLIDLFGDGLALANAKFEIEPVEIAPLIERAALIRQRMLARDRSLIQGMVERVTLTDVALEITCFTHAIATTLGVAQAPNAPLTITVSRGARLTRSGRVLRLVRRDGTAAVPVANTSLVGLVVRHGGGGRSSVKAKPTSARLLWQRVCSHRT